MWPSASVPLPGGGRSTAGHIGNRGRYNTASRNFRVFVFIVYIVFSCHHMIFRARDICAARCATPPHTYKRGRAGIYETRALEYIFHYTLSPDMRGYGGIWGYVAGYSKIQRDSAGYSGVQRDTAGYSGIQRGSAGYYNNILQSTGYERACAAENPADMFSILSNSFLHKKTKK